MSYLVHICRTCDHTEPEHEKGRVGTDGKAYTTCTCCLGRTAKDINPEPTLRETYEPGTGKPQPLFAPGEARAMGGAPYRTCACDACQQQYQHLVNAA